ncbi:hypothetical protein N1851_000061 [Merluccius polli]|uniref:Uncharacterized protein n=1 Tax=Merluccius polli TaxID=89951 RepID=A0AA47ND27_MERPO|nr:hypothetical protein N1851_000061 [Merluccius polli]
MQGVKPGLVNNMVIISARPRGRRLIEGIRSNLYRGVTSPLPVPATLNVRVVYQDIPADLAPMITAMAISMAISMMYLWLTPCSGLFRRKNSNITTLSLETSLDMAQKIENSTKEQSTCTEWHRLRHPALPQPNLERSVTPRHRPLLRIWPKGFSDHAIRQLT